MNEWYDSHKKPSSNFRKLLQERIDEANPRRTLAAEETKRLAKLETLAENLSVEKTCKIVSYKRGLVKTSTHS